MFCDRMDVENSQRVLLSVFSALRDFFGKIFPQKVPFNFFMFCDRMDVENFQRVPLSVFSALRDFFSETFFPKRSPSKFSCFATMDFEKCERVHLLARQEPALSGTWRASSVVWVFREIDTRFVSLIL